MGDNRFCSRCGKKLNEEEDIAFCPKCGKPIISDYQEIINQASYQYSKKNGKKKTDSKFRNTLVIVIASLVLITGIGVLYLLAEGQKKATSSSETATLTTEDTTELSDKKEVDVEPEEKKPETIVSENKIASEDGDRLEAEDSDKMDASEDDAEDDSDEDAEDEKDSDKKIDKKDEKDKKDEEEDKHHYELFVANVTWKEAEVLCRDKGGHLATISSDAELKEITNLIVNEDKMTVSFYVGCTRDKEYVGDSINYCWIQKKDDKYETSPVLASLWLQNEPSYSGHDSEGIIIEEKYVDLVYREEKGKAYLNDVSNDILSQSPSFSGRVGYICEFE